MNRRDFLKMVGGGSVLVLVGCAGQSSQPTMLEMLKRQKGMTFFVENRPLNGRFAPYVVGITANGETLYEDRLSGHSWLFYIGDDPQHLELVDSAPSDYLVPPGKQVYAAYEAWRA
ncbi:MAG: twin-arginine translocation signal domain-containing protein [Candidatus Magasanikbacteria bacterium]|nr:twin-arginine translocation signal domain-containing protein [Candidatus Magasanikbacteria bacterium]